VYAKAWAKPNMKRELPEKGATRYAQDGAVMVLVDSRIGRDVGWTRPAFHQVQFILYVTKRYITMRVFTPVCTAPMIVETAET